MKPKTILVLGAILGGISILIGAMGAHTLKDLLTQPALDSFLTGSRYHMYHAILLVAISANYQFLEAKWMRLSVYFTLIGTLLFSGSIYLLSTAEITGFSAKSIVGPITPIGGLILVSAWFSLGISALKKS